MFNKKKQEPTKIFIDFETQSNNDIRLGVNHYMSCPDFRAYLLSYSIDGKRIITWDEPSIEKIPYIKEFQKVLEIIKSGNYLVISHNTNFDVSIWNKIFPDCQIDWDKTLDTSWLCRVLNVPASLENATKFFGISEKDLEGKKINLKYYKPIEIPEEDLQRIIEYNRQDVKSLIELYNILSKVDPEFLEANQKIFEMIQRQNEIKIDKKVFSELKKLKDLILEKTLEKALKEFPTYKKSKKKKLVSICVSANEIKKYITRTIQDEKAATLEDWLPSSLESVLELEVSTISKNKLEEELNRLSITLNDNCKTLIDLYRVLQSKGLSKYDTFQEYLEFSKNVIKDFQISHGAHTGRPAGKGLQLHNVSRPPKLVENFSSQTIINAIKGKLNEENFLEATQYLSSLLWACMIPDSKKEIIGRYDLSAIEPRVGAFLRNDKKTLELYENADNGKGKDEYTIFGELNNLPPEISRPVSKEVILGADYGLGHVTVRANFINKGLPDIGEKRARALIDARHRQNPGVKKAWYDLEKAFKLAVINGKSSYNHIEFERILVGNKKFIAAILPSGRAKFYADCGVSSNGKILYFDTKYSQKVELRAYLLYQNMVQSSACDVLFLKVAKVEKLKDVKVKLTIYDEMIVSTLPKNVKAIRRIMAEGEAAFPNMPLSFKGGESSTFWKGDKV